MTNTDDAAKYADMVNTALEFTIPVAHTMGVRAIEARPGFAASEVPITGNGNHFGVMYAGVLFTVAEVLGGAIGIASFDNSAYYPLVKDLQINFRRPAKTTIRASASLDEETIAKVTKEAEEIGKADFMLEAELTDTEGVVVATTRGLYQLRKYGT